MHKSIIIGGPALVSRTERGQESSGWVRNGRLAQAADGRIKYSDEAARKRRVSGHARERGFGSCDGWRKVESRVFGFDLEVGLGRSRLASRITPLALLRFAENRSVAGRKDFCFSEIRCDGRYEISALLHGLDMAGMGKEPGPSPLS